MISELACTAHPSEPAAVVALHAAEQLGAALCAGCATCTDTRCGDLGTILDTDHNDPWCTPHAEQYSGDEAVTGPDLVIVGSRRHLHALVLATFPPKGGRP